MDKVLTPEFRASYPYVFTPFKQKKDDGTVVNEYTVTAIFAKDADLSALKKAAKDVLIKQFGADESKWPENIRSPFRKCKEKWRTVDGKQVIPQGFEDGEAIWISFKAGEKYRPGVVDAKVQDITEPKDFYAGCYARASVNPWFYGNKPHHKGNKGVSFGLLNIQKLRDGESLGGGSSKPTDDFQPVDVPAGASEGKAAGAKSIFD